MVAELVMDRVAATLGVCPIKLRARHLYKDGDVTHFGMVRSSATSASPPSFYNTPGILLQFEHSVASLCAEWLCFSFTIVTLHAPAHQSRRP
jgi:Molybdopterin-binding domain of aldehyde dehydrogenase